MTKTLDADLIRDRDAAIRELMDAVSLLRNCLTTHDLEGLPLGIRTRLEFALRNGKGMTLHPFVSWVLPQ